MGDSSRSPRVGRRGFMQTSGAAAALIGTAGGAAIGAGLGRLLAESKAFWSSPLGGPDAEATLLVERPYEEDISAQLELLVHTPQGTFRQPIGPVTLTGGTTQLEVTLRYPFDDFVHGEYAYQAQLSAGGETLMTTIPVRYNVEPFLWFS